MLKIGLIGAGMMDARTRRHTHPFAEPGWPALPTNGPKPPADWRSAPTCRITAQR